MQTHQLLLQISSKKLEYMVKEWERNLKKEKKFCAAPGCIFSTGSTSREKDSLDCTSLFCPEAKV